MAITNNGTDVTLSSDLLPSGYTKPSTTTFTDYEYKYELTLNVAKATVENATRATTLTNIVDDVTVGIDAQVDTILGDFGTSTGSAYTEFYDIESSIPVNSTGDFYTNTAVSYVCKCRLYVKVD